MGPCRKGNKPRMGRQGRRFPAGRRGAGKTGCVAVAAVVVNPAVGPSPFSPTLSVEVSRVNIAVRVKLGGKYQIESTTDLSTWPPTGPAFVADDEDLNREFYVNTI